MKVTSTPVNAENSDSSADNQSAENCPEKNMHDVVNILESNGYYFHALWLAAVAKTTILTHFGCFFFVQD